MGKFIFKGFTLIEMLIVLIIISTLLMFSLYVYRPIPSIKLFQSTLNQFLENAHSVACINQLRVDITLTNYYIEAQSGEYNERLLIPYYVQIEGDSFYYTEIGNISKSQTWHIFHHHQQYQLIFYLGSGHFRVKI